MSALDDLKDRIDSAIYTNTEQDITGDGLQTVLDDMVDTMGVSVSQNTNTGGIIYVSVAQDGGAIEDVNKVPLNKIGKNKFTKHNLLSGHYLDGYGVEQENSNRNITTYIPITGNTAYYLSAANDAAVSGGSTIYMAFYDADFNIVSVIGAWNKSFTTPSDAAYMRISYNNSADDSIQLELGSVRTDYEEYNAVDGYIDVFDFEKRKKLIKQKIGTNLFDGSFSADGWYIRVETTEVIDENPNFRISNFISVQPSTEYCLSSKFGASATKNENAGIAFYDISKNWISTIQGSYGSPAVFTTPSNAYFVKFTYRKAFEDIQLEKGSFRSEYNGYNIIGGYNTSHHPLDSDIQKIASMSANDDVLFNHFPTAIKYGNSFALRCDIPNGLGDGVRIGYGYNDINAKYLKITSTNIEVWNGQPTAWGSHILLSQTPHSLTIDTFIQLKVQIDDNFDAKISLLTRLGEYNGSISFGESNGVFQFSPSVAVTNVVISVENSTLKSEIWAFGDSYFNCSDNTRVGYQLKQRGVTNLMMCGFGGLDATTAYDMLIKAINYNTPKFIVWAEGMNLPYESYWLPIYPKLVSLCDKLGIELILCTIPVPKSDAAAYAGKQDLTDFVRASGHRYIDTYKAVGSDSLGNWYNQDGSPKFQSDDNVHPTEIGAKAIANQWFIDFPEICNCISI